MKTLKTLFSFFFLSVFLLSCGADKMASTFKTEKTTNALGASCGCTANYVPVCGKKEYSDKPLTYENQCIANCHNATIVAQGNCECSESLMVCVQGATSIQTMSECEAKIELLDGVSKITKYVPCEKTAM